KPGEGRKLLMFSDSRQAAAFFAPYLSDTYRRIQRRRLVYQGLERAGAGSAPVSTQDVVAHARTMADQARLFHRRDSSQDQERAVAPWVMAEAVAVDDRQSLEGVGLLRLTLDRDPAWTAPGPLLSLGLSDEEAWDLLGELVRSLRQQGALTMPDDVPANHEIFSPRLGPIYVRGEGPEPTRKVLSWLPGRGTNRRVDYVTKVLRALGSHAHPDDLLRGMWRFLTSQSIDWLARSTPRGLGEVRQVDHELLRFAIVSAASPAFRCTTCSRVAPVSVRGICPAMGCSGRLERFVPPTSGDLDHYRSLYTAMTPVPLTAVEHTAQWLNTEAAKIQQEFIRGDVNALSCSTTFELGVDVGELQAVMLRNVPPSTANYVQRAGRAGRRASAAALVVTYAQRRSHDLTHFADPMALMSGTVRAPYVPLENPRIAVRHVYSVAMSAFFRWDLATNHRMSRTAGDFFLGSDAQEASVHSVRTFLTPVSPEVKASVSRILPASVRSAAGVEDDSWVTGLLDLL
ncbi:MAG TPA: helicase-related protein, partial [Quisquiliibacterium sp.]|nr:helicase-related protein [Quisquiliibacterium sp.]